VCLSVFLVDRVGRLPLLKVSSVTAVAVVSVVVGMAGTFAVATQTDMNDLVTPARWPMYQLGTLAVLAVSVRYQLQPDTLHASCGVQCVRLCQLVALGLAPGQWAEISNHWLMP
jgi:hypothetical protein